jgi:hypothetical protein
MKFVSRDKYYKTIPQYWEICVFNIKPFYLGELKFIKYRKEITYREKLRRFREELERLKADKDEKRYLYKLGSREPELRDGIGVHRSQFFTKELKRELSQAKSEGRREFGGYWRAGEWVPKLLDVANL